MKLTKSLADLEMAADELLAKSKASEEDQEDKIEKEEITPEEISDDSTTSESEDAENAEAEKEKDDVEKSCNDDKLKKSDDAVGEDEDKPTEEDDIEKSEDAEEDEDEDSSEEIEKSLKDDFEADETIKKSVVGSEFASAIVEVLVKSLGDVQYDTHTAAKSQQVATDILAKSMQAVLNTNQLLQADNDRLTRRINKLEKSISQGFEKVMDTLDEISSQPAHMRKSLASVSVHDRDFDRSVNGVKTTGGFESLSKSQVMAVLNSELYAGNQNVTPSDIISYESGAPLKPDLQVLVASKCK